MRIKLYMFIWMVVIVLSSVDALDPKQIADRISDISSKKELDLELADLDRAKTESPTVAAESTTTTSTTTTTTTTTTSITTTTATTDEAEAKKQIDNMEAAMQPLLVANQQAAWEEAVDDSPEHLNASADAQNEFADVYMGYWNSVINVYQWQDFHDPVLKRRYEILAKPGTAALSLDEQAQLSSDISSMNAFALLKVCPYQKQDCDPQKDEEAMTMDQLEVLLATERDWHALLYYWETWRNIAGKPTKPFFVDLVDLENKAARAEPNNFTDASQMWVEPYVAPGYTAEDFTDNIAELWGNMTGLYKKLHGYVRFRLRNSATYKDKFGTNSPLPAHILGNMWAQDWVNIYDLVVPYPEVDLVNITADLQKISVKQMFEYAEDFFKSIDLYYLTPDFWSNSYMEQNPNFLSVCHASAWDFFSDTKEGSQTNGDFRIKMCTDKNQEDFIVIHHEMGHTQYQMAYSEEADGSHEAPPLIFRNSPNPGFHEAIGDTIALSVSTPTHLQGLADDINKRSPAERPRVEEDKQYKQKINQLMKIALDKIAFLPYAYILDKLRWDIFAGDVEESEYNHYWWTLRVEEQGVYPPVLRDADTDFDPGCKYHVANNVPYIRYFVAYMLQFQFQEKLCDVKNAAPNGTVEPLFECDIYGSTEAGDALNAMLVKGNSQPWTDTLKEFLEDEEGAMSAESIKKYFADLEQWLDDQEKAEDYELGWTTDVDKYFAQHIPATVPIVVGAVLAAMIVIVVVAYFVGKNRQEKNEKSKPEKTRDVEAPAGLSNSGFELGEKRKSLSSASSASSKK